MAMSPEFVDGQALRMSIEASGSTNGSTVPRRSAPG